MGWLGERPAYGSLLKEKNRTPRDKKPKSPKQKRMEDSENDTKHLQAIRSLPCCLPGCKTTKMVEAHHLKSAGGRGAGLKAKDRYTVPLCHEHHINGVERVSSRGEQSWFEDNGINEPVALADGLWTMTPDQEKMMRVLLAHWSEE